MFSERDFPMRENFPSGNVSPGNYVDGKVFPSSKGKFPGGKLLNGKFTRREIFSTGNFPVGKGKISRGKNVSPLQGKHFSPGKQTSKETSRTFQEKSRRCNGKIVRAGNS